MTIEDSTVIDGMGLDPNTDMVVLLISDHLDWADERHLTLFERKIGAYLEFIRSGQLTAQMPAATGKAILIGLYCQFEPSTQALRFLDAAKVQLRNEERVQFSYHVLSPE